MALRRILLAAIVLCTLLSARMLLADDAVLRDDSRLDQKVTLHVDGTAISAVLEQLQASSGVTMAAGLNDSDWSTRDRKVIVQVADMRLGDLMQQLSQVLHFHWSKGSADGKANYRLWQEKQELSEEESLRASGDSAQSKEARDKRENALADMVNLGSLSSSDAAGLKTADPWRYVLATEPLGRDVASLMSSFPEARNAFVQGTQASFAVSEMPAQFQETVRRIAQSYDSLTRSIGASEDHSPLLSKFDKLQVTINQRTPGAGDSSAVMSGSILGRISIGLGLDSFEIPLFDPASAMGKALGKAIISLKGGASADVVGKQLEADMTAAAKASETAASTRDITSDPSLKAKYKLVESGVPGAATLPTTLKLLALKTKLNIISDYFAGLAPVFDGSEKPLGEHLEAIHRLYGSNWTKSGSVVAFRDKEWFNKRAWAVPEVWMKYWADRGKINSGLLLDDLMQIGNLRDEQIDHTVMTDANLVHLGAGEAARNRQILRFYGGLTADQQKQLAGSKLEAASLTDDQWSLLKAALATKGAAYAAVQKGAQTVQLTQSSKDVVEYKFAFYPGANEPAVTFSLTSGVVYKSEKEVTLPEKVQPIKRL